MFVLHLTPKQQAGIAKLEGQKCETVMNGIETEALWNNGARFAQGFVCGELPFS